MYTTILHFRFKKVGRCKHVNLAEKDEDGVREEKIFAGGGNAASQIITGRIFAPEVGEGGD
jgi:hypothetical protein